ncbi:hypothetical protein HYS54_04810 [Candidatus Micrarchaeota archaeon]|nr:hypothetical protein [Candidatus Micrarchaeota archaeon]
MKRPSGGKKGSKEDRRHYALFASVLLAAGAASLFYGSTQSQSGHKLAGFALLFIGATTLLFLRFARIRKLL